MLVVQILVDRKQICILNFTIAQSKFSEIWTKPIKRFSTLRDSSFFSITFPKFQIIDLLKWNEIKWNKTKATKKEKKRSLNSPVCVCVFFFLRRVCFHFCFESLSIRVQCGVASSSLEMYELSMWRSVCHCISKQRTLSHMLCGIYVEVLCTLNTYMCIQIHIYVFVEWILCLCVSVYGCVYFNVHTARSADKTCAVDFHHSHPNRS